MLRIVAPLLLMLSFSVQAAPVCGPTFERFLTTFKEDKQFQKDHTHYPLSYSYIDVNAEPEPRKIQLLITSAADAQARKQPDYPPKAPKKSSQFEQKITRDNTARLTVAFNQPDTDYSIEYHFEPTPNCWHLVGIDDASL
ncbi:MAG: hypothetical protein ABWY06_11530 [Pseudomonas sp.]|uniref:hypothetical protein n=1 Tax=Pseudomonas sp. TaxID=306 RepID=UPI00339256F0